MSLRSQYETLLNEWLFKHKEKFYKSDSIDKQARAMQYNSTLQNEQDEYALKIGNELLAKAKSTDEWDALAESFRQISSSMRLKLMMPDDFAE